MNTHDLQHRADVRRAARICATIVLWCAASALVGTIGAMPPWTLGPWLAISVTGILVSMVSDR